MKIKYWVIAGVIAAAVIYSTGYHSFPDHWNFAGSIASQYKQIGNAVPVNLGYHIGRCVIAMLTGQFEDDMDVIQSEKVITPRVGLQSHKKK